MGTSYVVTTATDDGEDQDREEHLDLMGAAGTAADLWDPLSCDVWQWIDGRPVVQVWCNGAWTESGKRLSEVDVKAAVALIEARAASCGWADWSDLCDEAGIEKPEDLALTFERWALEQETAETRLLDGLRDAHVRLVRVPGDPARFVAERMGGVEIWRGMGRA